MLARCSLATGHLPTVTGVCGNDTQWDPETTTIYERATAAGYRTHAVGKCHFVPDDLWGLQTRERQDEIAAVEDDDYRQHLADQGYDWCLEPNGLRGDWYYTPQPSQLPGPLHPTTWVGDRSSAFIHEHDSGDQPWLLCSHFIHPHPPFSPPYPWSRLYRSHEMPHPLTAMNDVSTWINHRQNRYKWRDAGWDANLYRTMKAAYWGCISFIDMQVGRILQALEETHQLDNTLILFTSDHGEHLGDLGFVGKRSFHDASLRVPMLARLPSRFAAGAQCSAPTSLVDIAPTIAAAAGLEVDATWPGADLAHIAKGGGRPQPVTSHFEQGAKGIHCLVEADWKYAWSAGDGREYLFDRQQDPHDRCNLSGGEEHQERMAAMRECLRPCFQKKNAGKDNWPVYPPITMPDHPDDGLLYQDPPGLHGRRNGHVSMA